MADYTPLHPAGLLARTCTASAPVAGGDMVAVSGDGTIGPATSGGAVVGVAGHDAGTGTPATVHPIAGVVHELVAGSGGVTAGQAVMVGSDPNEVLPHTGSNIPVGVALTTASAGDPVQVLGMADATAPASGGGTVAWDDITDKPATFTTSSSDITDATAVGVDLLTASDAAAARAAIGAGTSDLELGTTSSTAAAGDHTHAGLTADQAAGTASIRTLGTGAQQAAAGNHTHNGLMTGSAAAVEDSEAAALEDLVTDFNALLAALRNRGVIGGGA